MFKSLREKLAAWRQKAEAEVQPEGEGVATPATESAPVSKATSASRPASAPRLGPAARSIGESARTLHEDNLEEILYALEMFPPDSYVAFPVATSGGDPLA